MSDEAAAGRAWLRQARAKGHDAFGIMHSAETLRMLAEAGRQQFLSAPERREELQSWVDFTVTVAGLPSLSLGDRHWVLAQLALLRGLPASYDVQSARAHLERAVSDAPLGSENEQLAELVRQVEWLLSRRDSPLFALVLQALGGLLTSRADQEPCKQPSEHAVTGA